MTDVDEGGGGVGDEGVVCFGQYCLGRWYREPRAEGFQRALKSSETQPSKMLLVGLPKRRDAESNVLEI